MNSQETLDPTEEKEMSLEERISRLESQLEGANAALAYVMEKIKELQDRGLLNKDSEDEKGTF